MLIILQSLTIILFQFSGPRINFVGAANFFAEIFFLLGIFSFWYFFLFLSWPPFSFHFWSFSPLPWKRVPPPQSGVPDSCLVLPCGGESPAPGTVSPQCKCCLRENGTPQARVARNPARVRRVVPFPGWPQAPVRSSGSPLSIFPRGHFASSPSECKRFPPSGENPETHEVLAPSQDSVPFG